MKTFILLPAYNEEAALKSLLPAIQRVFATLKASYRILVVDDGSQDGTADLLRQLAPDIPIEHLRHIKNQGYGAALNTGYSWIAAHAASDDAALSLDADNTHNPVYFPRMLEKLDEGFDIVTASYAMPGGRAYGVSPRRRILSFGVNFLFKFGAPIKGVHTYTNGFRAIRVSALQRLTPLYPKLIDATGFAGGTELFLRLTRAGARAAEIPFDLHYEMRGDQSKINIRRTIAGYLRLLARYGWWSNAFH